MLIDVGLYFTAIGGLAVIVAILTGMIIRPVRVPATTKPELNPVLRQPTLPFDKNLAAIGVIEPELVTETDWEEFDRLHPPVDFDEYVIKNGCGEVVSVCREPVRARLFENVPTKTELRWRNTLLDSPAP